MQKMGVFYRLFLLKISFIMPYFFHYMRKYKKNTKKSVKKTLMLIIFLGITIEKGEC
jgi:hypothetical protein